MKIQHPTLTSRASGKPIIGSDYQTLFKKDPAAFFEAVLINILWDKEPSSVDMALVERQKRIFLKWLEFYAKDIADRLDDRNQATMEVAYEAAKRHGHKVGQIYALANLPMKKSILGPYVDLIQVAETLRKLKAEEPKGVVQNGITRIN
jgi:hypothetical protein